jgi:pimeloyl-ACP methyl ester carboxylesterase
VDISIGARQLHVTVDSVVTSDNVELVVYQAGDPNGPPILFIHGFGPSHAIWKAQFNSIRLKSYRLITFDLRGHGLSSKPRRKDSYTSPSYWADDIQRIIERQQIRQPVIVAWSLGASVFCHYLQHHGTDVRAVNFVSARMSQEPRFIGPESRKYRRGLFVAKWGVGKIPVLGGVLDFLIDNTPTDAKTARENTLHQIEQSIPNP